MNLQELLPFLGQLPGQPPVNQLDPMPQEEPMPSPEPESQGGGLASLVPWMDKLPGQQATPAPSPATVAPPTSVGSSESKSTSNSGFSAAKNAQVVAGPGSRLDQRIAKDTAAIEAKYAPLKQGVKTAGQEALAAETAIGTAEKEKFEAQSRGHLEVQGAYARAETETRKEAEQALAASNIAKNEYRTALQSIPTVNPNQLWETAGTQGRFGMSVAAFVHDFLGAKGIKTSAMDTINSAVSRNIQAQISNIERGKAVASGFKDLWEMQKSQSNSHMEAVTRMQGLMLKSVQAGIDSELGKYDSKLALAKSQQARALIDKEVANNEIQVQRYIDAATDQAADRQVTAIGHELSASVEFSRIAESRAAREQHERMTMAKQKHDTGNTPIIFDNTKSGGGKAIARIRPELAEDKELVRNTINKVTSTQTAMDGLTELNQLQSEMDASPDGLNKTRIAKEIDRRENALRSRIVMALVLDQSGKQVTDKEREYIEKLIPAKTWFTNGTNRRIIAQLIEGKGTEMNLHLKNVAMDLQPGDAAFGSESMKNEWGKGEITENKLIKEGAETPADQPVDKANKLITGPDSATASSDSDRVEMATTVGGSAIEDRWNAFRKANPDGVVPEQVLATGSPGLLRQHKEAYEANLTEAPKVFVGFDAYRRLAQQGDKEALRQLNLWADMGKGGVSFGAPDGTDPNTPEAHRRQLMALWALSEIRKGKSKK